MNTRSACPAFRWHPLTVGLLLLLALPFAARPAGPAEKPPCCRPALTNAPYSERSLFQLESTWTSDVGREVRLGVFRGRAQVVGMFFTHCEYACPIIVHDMKRIQAALPDDIRDRVDFLLVTFDTERDTPEALAAYRRTHHLATDHWTLLTSGPDDVRELAALLGINYQKDARGQFAHSNVITLLNPEGEVLRQQVGLNIDPAESVKALTTLLRNSGPAGSAADR